jgi:hypothetical protein
MRTAPLKAMPLADLARAYEVLASPVCQCGRSKEIQHLALCTGCWRRLPAVARAALYARVGEGFEAAYERACESLKGQMELGI